jgi:hypothetical protein
MNPRRRKKQKKTKTNAVIPPTSTVVTSGQRPAIQIAVRQNGGLINEPQILRKRENTHS